MNQNNNRNKYKNTYKEIIEASATQKLKPFQKIGKITTCFHVAIPKLYKPAKPHNSDNRKDQF